MISEGYLKFTIVTFNFKDLVKQCNELKDDGYFMNSCTEEIQWPYFWKVKYEAIMVKRFIMDTETQEFAYLPKDII